MYIMIKTFIKGNIAKYNSNTIVSTCEKERRQSNLDKCGKIADYESKTMLQIFSTAMSSFLMLMVLYVVREPYFVHPDLNNIIAL